MWFLTVPLSTALTSALYSTRQGSQGQGSVSSRNHQCAEKFWVRKKMLSTTIVCLGALFVYLSMHTDALWIIGSSQTTGFNQYKVCTVQGCGQGQLSLLGYRGFQQSGQHLPAVSTSCNVFVIIAIILTSFVLPFNEDLRCWQLPACLI